MEKTWRWFGKKDKITLDILRQIGVEGVVTALDDLPKGEVWSLEAILGLKQYIESFGLRWSVVDSLPVSESIKYGGENRDKLIENYIISLENLGKAGIKTICYNFTPILDWVRTDLEHKWEDGASSLYFDKIKFAYYDIYILEREGANKDYSKYILEQVEKLRETITDEDKERLIDTITFKIQRFDDGVVDNNNENPLARFKRLLALYDGIDHDILRNNLKYFLERIMPVCDQYDINMCIHPDDPPFLLMGLPRIVTGELDIEWLLNAVDNPHNGLAFCAGSLSGGVYNNVPQLAQKFASRAHFVHLWSTDTLSNGDLIEVSHLEGFGYLIEVVRVFEKEKPNLAMCVDHGRMMFDDAEKGYHPGYSFYGRILAFGQMEGVIATVRDELSRLEQ